MIRRLYYFCTLLLVAVLLVACGGGEPESAPAAEPVAVTTDPDPQPEPEPEPMVETESAETDSASDMDEMPAAEPDTSANPVTVNADGTAQVTIGSTDLMQYTVNAFEVDAGQQVELTLVHEGELPIDVMGHNMVILPTDGDYVAFSQQVVNSGGSVDNGYLPESMRAETIAYTSLIGGGESDTISFTAPSEPGDYPFVCTFPGHFGIMNGIMTVR